MQKQHSIKRKLLRLILGDQLNINHSWFSFVDPDVTYVLMETRSETDYVTHHIQKVAGFFAAMRAFATQLESAGHRIIYIRITDAANLQRLDANCDWLIRKHAFTEFEYLLPDEYRVDELLHNFCKTLSVSSRSYDTEHFYTQRSELAEVFKNNRTFLMENFYRYMRRRHDILMNGTKPMFGKWNTDAENRKKLPAGHVCTPPLLFDNDVREITAEILTAGIVTMGTIEAEHFVWPVNRGQALRLLEFFVAACLPLFGTYQDAMAPDAWSMYHSRLSFALNVKLISPKEVVDRVIKEYYARPEEIEYHQLEGFVRQIIGWREYMRGIYWLKMPEYASLNFFGHEQKLPAWYWSGQTKLNCLKHSITQSLTHAYAHHIQRLMVTGNFALLAGVHPDEVDQWYLGIYIDALDWVEITNTRGMSQFADGGLVATKPYVSSAAYIDKMSHYCSSCYYKKQLKTGHRACPFNSLYWHFLARNEALLKSNQRMRMMYTVWYKTDAMQRKEILEQAEKYLSELDQL